jgi:hypothetical protein
MRNILKALLIKTLLIRNDLKIDIQSLLRVTKSGQLTLLKIWKEPFQRKDVIFHTIGDLRKLPQSGIKCLLVLGISVYHCLKVWQRDVNACRYLVSYLLILLGILL